MEPLVLEQHNLTLVKNYPDPKLWSGLTNPNEFDMYEKVAWMEKNWTISIYASIIYLIVIFGLEKWMKERKPFNLKGPLILWNFFLALFSMGGSYMAISEMITFVQQKGFHLSVCGTLNHLTSQSSYWIFLFVFSKIFELGDTLFLVLRKRKLIFLHWFHHISILMMAWLSLKGMVSTGAWCTLLNYTVHGIMYTYFGLTAMGFKFPKLVSMSITATQLAQFVIGIGVHAYAIREKVVGGGCGVANWYIYLSMCLGLTYLFLFAKFFYNSYLSTGRAKKVQ